MREPRNHFHAELLAYRMNLPLPAELDIRKSVIEYWVSEDPIEGFTQRVRTSFPIGNYYNFAPEFDAERREKDSAARKDAQRKWQERYHHTMPEDVEVQDAESSFAPYFPYDGPTHLSSGEAAALAALTDSGDFTLDMLWLIVEGLGWKPGVPVPEDDEGWIAVWAEDYECACYLEIVRFALGMPESPMLGDRSWVPPAVAKLKSYRQLLGAGE
ncbi:hypothetical protein G3N57_04220 [Paraburkholderia sp. Se-20369]|nr:hypothetical protein [Paraburkholderia sp. Se-20369]